MKTQFDKRKELALALRQSMALAGIIPANTDVWAVAKAADNLMRLHQNLFRTHAVYMPAPETQQQPLFENITPRQ